MMKAKQNLRGVIRKNAIATLFAYLAVVGWSFLCDASPAVAEDTAKERQQSAVLVELFTSEGCSSCPPADDNLKRLTKLAKEQGFPIHTLSYHVDYWDYLGWKDRFSSAAATKRQRQYSAAFRLNRIYTPQFVVNGQWQLVGSNRAHTRTAILKAMEEHVASEINVTANTINSTVQVKLSFPDAEDGSRFVVALVQNSAESNVTKGENSGRVLNHVHIVRDFTEVAATKSLEVTFQQPTDFAEGEYHVLAYLQSAKDLSLLGIKKANISVNAALDADSDES